MEKYEISGALLIQITNLLKRLPYNDIEGTLLQLQSLDKIYEPHEDDNEIGFQAIYDKYQEDSEDDDEYDKLLKDIKHGRNN